MATSTFGKQFYVQPDKSKEFEREMTRLVSPTLKKDFKSNLVHLTSNKSLKDHLVEVLNK